VDYIKEYKSFINSYYLGEGLRITAGVVLPAVVLGYFGYLNIGTVVSLGAICVSMTDIPGPIHHRSNGMQASIIVIFIMSVLTGYCTAHPLALGILIAVSCFLASMVGVYGARVNAIGVSALVVMILNIAKQHSGTDIWLNALYIAGGGIWYTLLSLALYRVRPYKIIQQTLGDCIMATASYLRTRARFYQTGVDYENIYRNLMVEQAQVHHKQELVRELLFKSRRLSKESTTTGRTLVMIFTDLVDLFEKAMTSFFPYETLHKYFDDTEVPERFRRIIISITHELDDIGIAVKAGKPSREPLELLQQLKQRQEYIQTFTKTYKGDRDALVPLQSIMQAIEDMIVRIDTLQDYTRYDKEKAKQFKSGEYYRQFVSTTDLDRKIFTDNLSLQSNSFRHALRVSIACTAGFIISQLLTLGHSYWILLTIIVILKPTYSLTTKRNYERLLGTVAGALLGVLIIYLIPGKTTLFIIMLLLMTLAYSFMRTNYLISVLCMTPYVLVVFHLLDSSHFKTIVQDRLVDTAIGSLIAFAANFLLVPAWEREQIKTYMAAATKNCLAYFNDVAARFSGKQVTELQYKLDRKNAFVAQANLSEAFSRMLAEPKNKQKDSKRILQFVVLIHTLTSHIATLSHIGKLTGETNSPDIFRTVVDKTTAELTAANEIIETGSRIAMKQTELPIKEKNDFAPAWKPATDQFFFIARIAEDTRKICETIITEETNNL
jgi:uncharacterized membrane protein (TIGR01666 family)